MFIWDHLRWNLITWSWQHCVGRASILGTLVSTWDSSTTSWQWILTSILRQQRICWWVMWEYQVFPVSVPYLIWMWVTWTTKVGSSISWVTSLSRKVSSQWIWTLRSPTTVTWLPRWIRSYSRPWIMTGFLKMRSCCSVYRLTIHSVLFMVSVIRVFTVTITTVTKRLLLKVRLHLLFTMLMVRLSVIRTVIPCRWSLTMVRVVSTISKVVMPFMRMLTTTVISTS